MKHLVKLNIISINICQKEMFYSENQLTIKYGKSAEYEKFWAVDLEHYEVHDDHY